MRCIPFILGVAGLVALRCLAASPGDTVAATNGVPDAPGTNSVVKAATNAGPASPMAGSNTVAAGSASTNTAVSAAREPAGEAAKPESPRRGYAAFTFINDRNIFNPNRSRRVVETVSRPRPKAVVTDSFTLVGTMIYSNKQVAFFDGSGSRFKKAVQPKDTIGDHTLVSVEIDKVRLENKGRIIDFAIGAQFRRQDDGPWEMIASTIGSRAADAPAKSGGDQGGATAGDDDEIVRRLLKKREQELNK